MNLRNMLATLAMALGLGPAPVPKGNRPAEVPAPSDTGPRKRRPKVYARPQIVGPVVLMYPGPGQRRAGMSAETEARVRAAQRAQALAATNPRTRRMYGLAPLGGVA